MSNEETHLAKQIKEIIRWQAMMENKIRALYECSPTSPELEKVWKGIEDLFSGSLEIPKDLQRRPGK